MDMRKYLIQLVPDSRTVGFDRVKVKVECKLSGNVDGESHHVAADIDRLAEFGELQPAILELVCGRHKPRKECSGLSGRKR